jgi:dipeptidyl aminopeptidase/acylaminoacyl peptidase
MEVHNQLFLPKDLKPGERRPALVFVHGGPPRQMLPLYHYMGAYTWMYAFNQYLADQGYVVISVNFRMGIGYGRSFTNAPGTMTNGNAEYQDVVAGAKYLQSRPDVDPTRIGIYGQSYGGLLTAQALASQLRHLCRWRRSRGPASVRTHDFRQLALRTSRRPSVRSTVEITCLPVAG